MLLAVGLLAAGAASLGLLTAPARRPGSVRPSTALRPPTVGAASTTTSTAPTGAAPPAAPSPAPPGPLAVDGAAWAGNGELAFVSKGELEVLGDAGDLTAVTGPSGGFDSNPAWSADGRWLAFLNSVPAGPFSVAPATLWVVHAGAPAATKVSTSGVAEYAWSPVASVLAYATTGSGVRTPTPGNLFTDVPGELPVNLPGVGPGFGVTDLAWSPDGTAIAYDDVVPGAAATATTPGRSPVVSIGTVPAAGGISTVAYQRTDGTGLTLAGWWPDGRGLLFWEAPGGGTDPDGKPLDSLAAGGSNPVLLAQTLGHPFALAADPAAAVEAVVADPPGGGGLGRSIWSPGRDVALCDLVSGACRPVAVPSGDESLAPAFTSSGTLLYATASASGPFGTGAGAASAGWSSGDMAEWDATNRLWALPPGGTAAPLAQAGNGALLGVPAASGDGLVVVRDDALWLTSLGSTGPAVQVAGPLYSNAAPSGYYGEVDWAGTFAWSSAGGPRGGSAELVDEGYDPPTFESP